MERLEYLRKSLSSFCIASCLPIRHLLTQLPLLVCLVLLLAINETSAQNRVALVIGNDAYKHLPNLANAGKDARDMASKLSKLGFDVITRYNASEKDIIRALHTYSARLSNGGTGLVYYAGHGVQSEGRNFILPSDSQVELEEDLESEAVNTDRILQAMRKAANALNILILDACRDNPLPRTSRSTQRGLAVTKLPEDARGTAIFYAAGPGQAASDGNPGKNGVFTAALLEFIDKPGWSLDEIFKATSRRVLKVTRNRQRPWQVVSMRGNFIFNTNPVLNKKPVVRVSEDADQESQKELEYWASISQSKSSKDFSDYLTRYPNGSFVVLAKKKQLSLSKLTRRKEAPKSKVTALGSTTIGNVNSGIDGYWSGFKQECNDTWGGWPDSYRFNIIIKNNHYDALLTRIGTNGSFDEPEVSGKLTKETKQRLQLENRHWIDLIYRAEKNDFQVILDADAFEKSCTFNLVKQENG